MKTFQSPSIKTKNIVLKKKCFLIASIFCLFNLHAQDRSTIKLGIEPGIPIKTHSENLGLLLNVEPTIEISTNSTIGLRFGLALNAQNFENNGSSQFNFDQEKDHAVISFVPTFDYYFNDHYTQPYLSVGAGYYLTSSIVLANPTQNVTEGTANNQLGFLVRGGFKIGRTKLGAEYNLVPKADIKIPDGQTIGTVDNTYFGLTIGFTIGGRKS